MQLKTYFAQDASGNIMPGAAVTVYLANTMTLATGLEDENGSPLSNPFTADSSAKVAFYAPDGLYDITVVGNGRTVTIRAQFVSVDGASVLRDDLAAPGGSALVGSDDGASGSLWTTVAGFIAFLLSSLGASVIGFIQAGVGAVWRSVMEKLRERISPEDFGAVGDDIADDFHALQKAFYRAASIRGAVELSKGKTYKCSGTLNTGNATLVGGGGRPTIHYTGTANLFGNIVRMSGVRITGSGKASTAIGVLIEDGYRNWIEDNQFDNIGKGVQISGSGQTIVGNLFTGCGTGCHVVKYSPAFNDDPTTTFTSRKNWYEDCDNGLWDDATGASSGGISNCSDNDIFQRNTGYGLRLTSQSFPFTLINPNTEQNSLVAGHYAFGFFNSNVSLVGGYQGASDVNNIDSNTLVTRHTGAGVLAWTRYRIASRNGAKVFLDVNPNAAVPNLQFPCDPTNQTVTFVGGGYAATNSARINMQGGRGDNGNYYGSFIESQRSTSIGNGVNFFVGAIQAGASSDTYTRLVGLTYTGILYPNADNTQSLGTASFRWSTVYAGTGTINTSDAREKQQIRRLTDAERAVAARLKALIRAFKFNDAVGAKGEGARIHVGVIAQDVKSAFEAEGLVAEGYAALCLDEWEEQPEIIAPVLDDDGNPTGETFVAQEYRPAGNRYGVRYEELLAFIIAAL